MQICRLLLIVTTLSVVSATGFADDPETPDQLVVERCRIKLIDQVTLASGQNGILKFLDLQEGSVVADGDVVARLDDGVATAALAVAEKEAVNDIEIRYAKKAAEVARTEYLQSVEANRRAPGAVSGLELERLKLTAERAYLQIEQADHDHELAVLRRDESQEVLNSFRIVAPFDGIVTRVVRHRGEAVRQGDPVLELSSTARVRVEAEVDVKYMNRLQKGTPVLVKLESLVDDQVKPTADAAGLPGKISFIDVSVVPVSRKIRIWAEVPNPDAVLIAGLTAKMTIVLDGKGPNPKVAKESRFPSR